MMAVMVACVARAEQRYTVKALEAGPASFSYTTALNDLGHAAGFSYAGSEDTSFFWSEESGRIDLAPDWNGKSLARAINNTDVIVGQLTGPWPDYTKFAFMWRDGRWTKVADLVAPGSGWTFTDALDVNDAGQIVGQGNRGGFLLIPGEPYYEIVRLRDRLGYEVTPYAINNSGAIAGTASVNYRKVAFLWSDNTFHRIGTLGGDEGHALDVSESLQVVGYAQTAADETYGHAFLWDSGVMQDLGTFGGENSYAYRINDNGLILGGAESLLAWGGDACIWREGRIRRLKELVPCGMSTRLAFELSGLNNLDQMTMGADQEYGTQPWLLSPLSGAIRTLDVSVFRGSTIEVDLETSLPEESEVGIQFDDECIRVTIDARGRARTRRLNQSGAHTVCLEGMDDSCVQVECDPRPAGFVICEPPQLPEGDSARVSAINDRGEVVGQSDNWYGRYHEHAALWRSGEVIDLGTMGGAWSDARDINELGWVVGVAENSSGANRACLWRDGQIIDVGTPEREWGDAEAVNARGQIVGSVDDGDRSRAFLWENGVLNPLPCPDETRGCDAVDINDEGEVVGTWSDANYERQGYRWSSSEGIVLLETLGHGAWVHALKRDGDAVGSVWDYSLSGNHPALWDRAGRLTSLPLLYRRSGTARGVNESGDIVGSEEVSEGNWHAMLWRDDAPKDLNDLIYPGCAWDVLTSAGDINNAGQIIGYGYRDGEGAPFVMTPAYPGNIKRLSVRCKGEDLVVGVKSWLPARTTLTAASDTGPTDCMTTDASGRGKVRLYGAAGASSVCLLEYADMCEAVQCN